MTGMVDRWGRRIRNINGTDFAWCDVDGCRQCFPSAQKAYQHLADTDHTVLIKRTRVTEVSKP